MTAYDMRISDWSSDVCSSDLIDVEQAVEGQPQPADDRGAPASGGVGCRVEKDQPRAEIGEADVADEMRVGRAGGDDGGDEDIPVERLYEHEGAVGDRRDRGDEQQQLDEAVESVGLGGQGGLLLLGGQG